MDGFKMGVLLLWTVCLLAITGWFLRLIWIARPLERGLTLALFLMTAATLRRRHS